MRIRDENHEGQNRVIPIFDHVSAETEHPRLISSGSDLFLHKDCAVFMHKEKIYLHKKFTNYMQMAVEFLHKKSYNIMQKGDGAMHRFDYSFLDNGLLPAQLLNLTADIYGMRAMAWDRKDQFSEAYAELEQIAKVQSVKSSNEIEGIVTTDERIKEIVRGNGAPLNHDEQEIAGYRDALAAVHAGYSDMDFTEAVILRLHAIMLNIAGYAYAGQYKEYDNDIIVEDASGRRRVRFHPTAAADTPAEMEQLVLAYRDARDNPNVNQLLLIPCVILDFLCIHPFRDDGVIIRTSQLRQAKSRLALICPNFLSQMGHEVGRRRKISYLRTEVGWECAAA